MRNPWTPEENNALLRAYGQLVDAQAEGQYLSKAGLIRQLQAGILHGRSKGSIEAKLMNISAACVKAGTGFVKGYKPAPNMQRCLLTMTASWIDQRRTNNQRGATPQPALWWSATPTAQTSPLTSSGKRRGSDTDSGATVQAPTPYRACA